MMVTEIKTDSQGNNDERRHGDGDCAYYNGGYNNDNEYEDDRVFHVTRGSNRE